MAKRRFLGHVSSILQLKAEAEKALTRAINEGHFHGSQIFSGSVYVTDPDAKMYLRGTDEDGDLKTYSLEMNRGLFSLVPTGSN